MLPLSLLFISASAWAFWRCHFFQKAEEAYARNVIVGIAAGTIALPYGGSIRTYLADQLECDPMVRV
jgi:hypothetical protein